MVYSLTNCQFYHIAQESPDAIVLTKIQTQTNYLWLQSLKQLLEEGVLAIQKDNQFSVTKNFATEANLHKMAIRIFRESSIATPDSSETAIPSAPSEIISSSNFTIMSEEEKQGVLIAIEKELEKEGTILEEDQKDKKNKTSNPAYTPKQSYQSFTAKNSQKLNKGKDLSNSSDLKKEALKDAKKNEEAFIAARNKRKAAREKLEKQLEEVQTVLKIARFKYEKEQKFK